MNLFVFCRKELHADNHSIHEPTASGYLSPSHKGHSGRTAGAAKWVPPQISHIMWLAHAKADEWCGTARCMNWCIDCFKNEFSTTQCTKTAFEELQACSVRGNTNTCCESRSTCENVYCIGLLCLSVNVLLRASARTNPSTSDLRSACLNGIIVHCILNPLNILRDQQTWITSIFWL